eukprot:CAMPEP_0119388978 /NCGR_PEP_ID=MMETSP1334-20130426/107224_1 /TAXON_ID=127549 /ORGANISM="Calcidiscus leptoporus, Strain RCC1130" /LENGTH=61 /DNA_ID=CAMNT_0007411105 /DNA_START=27 /DNA_END=209 /DNA_ORIENTATION=+
MSYHPPGVRRTLVRSVGTSGMRVRVAAGVGPHVAHPDEVRCERLATRQPSFAQGIHTIEFV